MFFKLKTKKNCQTLKMSQKKTTKPQQSQSNQDDQLPPAVLFAGRRLGQCLGEAGCGLALFGPLVLVGHLGQSGAGEMGRVRGPEERGINVFFVKTL